VQQERNLLSSADDVSLIIIALSSAAVHVGVTNDPYGVNLVKDV